MTVIAFLKYFVAMYGTLLACGRQLFYWTLGLTVPEKR